jgi:hypothetical protein
MSDLSPECAPKRTSVDHFELWVHAQIARRANHFVFSEMVCPAPLAKIFPFAPDPNHFYIPRRLVPQRGGSRVVTNAGRDAVDARASGAQWQSQGEMNLVSGQLACETIGALADGKAVWS